MHIYQITVKTGDGHLYSRTGFWLDQIQEIREGRGKK